MEQRFSVEVALDKKIYREFGYLHMKRSKAWAAILGCDIVLMVFCVMIALFDFELRVFWIVMTMLFYFYWLFSDLYCGSISYRSANKKTRGTPTHLTFTEDGLASESALGSGKNSYAAFMDVIESDSLFAVYLSKASAILVPKDGFTEGTVDAFRDFIAEKIGPVRRVKPSKRRRLLGILLGVCFVAAMIGATLLRGYWDARLTAFGKEPYSICLPAAFEPFEIADYHFTAESDEVYVYVSSESQEELHSYGIYDLDTVTDYAEDLVISFHIDDPTFETLENGTVCMTYIKDFDDVSIFYCDAIIQSGDTFWLTEFYCDTAQRDEYAPQFLNWAATIQIAAP